MTDGTISIRECDSKHTSLNGWIEKIEERIGKVESVLWWMMTLLVTNLVGVIALLLKG